MKDYVIAFAWAVAAQFITNFISVGFGWRDEFAIGWICGFVFAAVYYTRTAARRT